MNCQFCNEHRVYQVQKNKKLRLVSCPKCGRYSKEFGDDKPIVILPERKSK